MTNRPIFSLFSTLCSVASEELPEDDNSTVTNIVDHTRMITEIQLSETMVPTRTPDEVELESDSSSMVDTDVEDNDFSINLNQGDTQEDPPNIQEEIERERKSSNEVIRALKEKNEELNKEIVKLRNMVANYDEIKSENESLKLKLARGSTALEPRQTTVNPSVNNNS